MRAVTTMVLPMRAHLVRRTRLGSERSTNRRPLRLFEPDIHITWPCLHLPLQPPPLMRRIGPMCLTYALQAGALARFLSRFTLCYHRYSRCRTTRDESGYQPPKDLSCRLPSRTIVLPHFDDFHQVVAVFCSLLPQIPLPQSPLPQLLAQRPERRLAWTSPLKS